MIIYTKIPPQCSSYGVWLKPEPGQFGRAYNSFLMNATRVGLSTEIRIVNGTDQIFMEPTGTEAFGAKTVPTLVYSCLFWSKPF